MGRKREWVIDDGRIFDDLVNRAAHFDRIAVNLSGQMSNWQEFKGDVLVHNIFLGENVAIGGEKRPYARMQVAQSSDGVEIRFKYARQLYYVPPCRLLLRSVRTPIRACHVEEAICGFMDASNYSACISEVELTFDIRCSSIELVSRQVATRMTRYRLMEDESGRKTFYFGGPRSYSQLRIYQKATQVVRIEVILRLPFLRARKIKIISDVAALRNFDLGAVVRLRVYRKDAFSRVTKRYEGQPEYRARAFPALIRFHPVRSIEREFRRRGWSPHLFLRQSPLQRQLQKMLRRLVF
jgi:hypothetical protein